MKRKLPIKIQEALKHLDEGVEMLRGAGAKNAPNLKFTLDGRLIGDIGELLAASKLGIKIPSTQNTPLFLPSAISLTTPASAPPQK